MDDGRREQHFQRKIPIERSINFKFRSAPFDEGIQEATVNLINAPHKGDTTPNGRDHGEESPLSTLDDDGFLTVLVSLCVKEYYAEQFLRHCIADSQLPFY